MNNVPCAQNLQAKHILSSKLLRNTITYSFLFLNGTSNDRRMPASILVHLDLCSRDIGEMLHARTNRCKNGRGKIKLIY